MNTGKYFLFFLALTMVSSCSAIREILPTNRKDAAILTARVVRKPVEAQIHTVGELQPIRSATITAPPVSGGTLQIIYIVKTGTRVKEGDVIVEFDPSEQEFILEQNRSQLAEAEQRMKKMQVDQAVRVAQEKVTLLNAEANVRRAELKIKENELLGKIQARKNEIAVEEAKRKLEQLQSDIRSHAETDMASLASQNAAYVKAKLAMELAQQNIENMILRAPIEGIVVLRQNVDALYAIDGVIYISDIPEFKEGGQAAPGQVIAQIQDTGQMEVHAKVLETERENLMPGQPVDIWVNSRPEKPFAGWVKSLDPAATSITGATSTLERLESMSSRSFGVIFEFDPGEEELKLGLTARIIIHGRKEENALSIPREAVFEVDGSQVVYIMGAEGWQAQDIQVEYFTESRAVLDGLEEGTEVALVSPSSNKGPVASESNPLSSLSSGVNP